MGLDTITYVNNTKDWKVKLKMTMKMPKVKFIQTQYKEEPSKLLLDKVRYNLHLEGVDREYWFPSKTITKNRLQWLELASDEYLVFSCAGTPTLMKTRKSVLALV